MIRTAGLTGEVIIPSMTYVATAHAVRSLGLTPVFCDLDPLTGCIDPDRVEELITPDTSGLIGVHLWGQPCDVERLEKIAEAHDLTLFFDAAHGVACSLGDTPIGGFGTAEMFSFHATKVLNTFEGGAIVTNDDRFADRARRVHNFGWGEGRMTDFVGVNAKMNEASGAMGLTSLEALPSSIAANHANYVLYSAELSGLPGVTVHQYDDRNRNNYQYVVVKVDEQVCGLPRDAVLALLHADNVLAQRYFWPCAHELEPYRTETPTALPATEHLAAQVIALPTGPRTSRDTIGRICGLIRLAARNAPEVSARWRLTNPT
jgi:dTDP-4-amino-4,6-dideoxyglucose